ncbi:MAG: hypothetical protein WBK28_00235 [Minisyncoccia bacterium]
MLNVVNRDKRISGRRLPIVWSILRKRLALELTGSTPLEGGLRAYYWPDTDPGVVERWLKQAVPHWEQQGYRLFAKTKDDTDSQIVGAMARLVGRAVRLGYKKLRIVVVSGDAIFGDEFEELRREYEGKIALELIVYSWPSALSVSLGRIAKRFRSLASVQGLVRRT